MPRWGSKAMQLLLQMQDVVGKRPHGVCGNAGSSQSYSHRSGTAVLVETDGWQGGLRSETTQHGWHSHQNWCGAWMASHREIAWVKWCCRSLQKMTTEQAVGPSDDGDELGGRVGDGDEDEAALVNRRYLNARCDTLHTIFYQVVWVTASNFFMQTFFLVTPTSLLRSARSVSIGLSCEGLSHQLFGCSADESQNLRDDGKMMEDDSAEEEASLLKCTRGQKGLGE